MSLLDRYFKEPVHSDSGPSGDGCAIASCEGHAETAQAPASPPGRSPGSSTDQKEESPIPAPQRIVVEEAPPRDLFNGKAPAYDLKRERVIHRAIIMMAATGETYRAIAEALGVTPVMVSYVVNQPWAKEQILKEIEKAGRSQVLAIIHDHSLAAVEKIIDVMQNAKSKETQLKAANALLDREFGRPTQPIAHLSEHNLDECDDAELAKIALAQN